MTDETTKATAGAEATAGNEGEEFAWPNTATDKPNYEKKHALLSASSSHRWLECTPSAREEECLRDLPSDYALEGTLAHAFCARRLKREVLQLTETPEEDAEIAELYEQYYSPEMDGYVDEYVSKIKCDIKEMRRSGLSCHVKVEKTVDYSKYAPEGFGTVDCLILTEWYMCIYDFKYGKGVEVSAGENPQLKLYALGAIETYAHYGFEPEFVSLTVIQPRVKGKMSYWETMVYDLKKWGDTVVKPAAELAYKGTGERNAGEWCLFCRAKRYCRVHAGWMALKSFEGLPDGRMDDN